MDHPFRVSGRETVQHLQNEPHGLIGRPLPPYSFQVVLEIFPVDVLQGDEPNPVDFSCVIDLADQRMIDLRGRFGFDFHPFQDLGRTRRNDSSHLERDQSIEFDILRQIDRTHLSLAKSLTDLVSPELKWQNRKGTDGDRDRISGSAGFPRRRNGGTNGLDHRGSLRRGSNLIRGGLTRPTSGGFGHDLHFPFSVFSFFHNPEHRNKTCRASRAALPLGLPNFYSMNKCQTAGASRRAFQDIQHE